MITRSLLLLAGISGTVMGQADLAFEDFKEHKQTSLETTAFEGGQVSVQLVDGAILIAGCAGQPSAGRIPPNIACPLGTTGFIAQGDVGDADGNPIPDGNPDDGSFWSVSSIIQAGTVEPFRADEFKISAAPPSGLTKLLRGSGGDINSVFTVEDRSVVVWYDYINFPIEEFKVTLYTMQRNYGVRGNQWVLDDGMDGAVVTGGLDDPLPDLATLRPNSLFWPVDSTTPNPFFACDLPIGDDPLVTPALRALQDVTVIRDNDDEQFPFPVPTDERMALELERQYFDVPWGSYLFTTPALNNPLQDQVFGVTLLVGPDVYPGRGAVPTGWRIINEDWSEGPFLVDCNGERSREERLEVDPRLFYDFIWAGINFQNTVESDELYLGMRANQYLTPAGSFATIDDPDPAFVPDPDPPNVLEDVLVFPPYQFDTPEGDRELFKLGIYDGHYELGPFFFQPGESVTAELDWRRNLEGGSGTRDISRRILHFDIAFIDTFWGFAFYSRGPIVPDGFPFGTPTSLRQPMLDKDNDGFSNLIEYATMADLDDNTIMPVITTTTGTAVGECSASTPKRPYVGDSLTYLFEFSSDGVVWSPILPGGIWDITETDTELYVVNNTDLSSSSMCLFRLRVIMNR